MSTTAATPPAVGPDQLVTYVAGESRLQVRRAWCKGCRLCLDACPAGLLALDDQDRVVVSDVTRCTFCGLCAARCPDFVFVLEPAAAGDGAGRPFRLTGGRRD
ncbi:MAG: 4Fe-4S dicluster domain-containing protein [Clostridia bacterium]